MTDGPCLSDSLVVIALRRAARQRLPLKPFDSLFRHFSPLFIAFWGPSFLPRHCGVCCKRPFVSGLVCLLVSLSGSKHWIHTLTPSPCLHAVCPMSSSTLNKPTEPLLPPLGELALSYNKGKKSGRSEEGEGRGTEDRGMGVREEGGR